MDNEIVFSGDQPASTISARVARGELVRLATGVYTSSVVSPPDQVVRSNWPMIVGRLFPEATITDRSARTGAPVDGVLYLTHDARPRDLKLPGLKVRARRGARPQPGDAPYPGGLHLASKARGLAENCLPSRSRGVNRRRTFDERELGDWIDYIRQNEGAEEIRSYRHAADAMADRLGVSPDGLATIKSLIGVALGTQEGENTKSRALASRRAGRPIDQVRIRKLETLADALSRSAPQSRPVDTSDPERYRYLPFFEAYFSNFIEGTEFEVGEARQIVFDAMIPVDRPRDAHDVVGTYRVVSDENELSRTGQNSEEFLDLLRRRNAAIMEGRPDKRPGRFKEYANRAGASSFVEPDLVEGTLVEGFRLRQILDTAWERAVYVGFLVAEVHPFDDGNGRTARVMMNAELVAGGQNRIVIPTVFRGDYLDGLRLLTRQDDPSVLIKASRYAHDFTASIDFRDFDEAESQLRVANAFEEPESVRRLKVLP